jgi:AbrB family looped-hinge helix DNA binding protein
MPKSFVAVNARGRITLPADVRRQLHLAEGDRLEVAVKGDRITLRPARVVVADALGYTAESLRSIRRALDDVCAGRVYQASQADLLAGRLPGRRARR